MAYTTTYAQLVADLQDITENTNAEFVAQIPRIIQRAQDNVQRDLGLEIWRAYPAPTVATVALTATVTRQATWLQVKSVYNSTSSRYLDQRHLDWVRMYGPSQGIPKYWTEVSENVIQLSPVPDGVYTLSFDVLERAPALSVSVTTNWFTQHAADLLLLASLIGSELYLASNERVATFAGLYDRLMQAAITELRTQERAGYTPTRAASVPSIPAGSHA